MSEHFFDEATEQSIVKATIVAKYFHRWANVMVSVAKKFPNKSNGKFAYIDLFAGPGRYKNGEKSTPIKVLEAAIQNEEIRTRLVTIFNDKDGNSVHSLEEEIGNLPNVQLLTHKPQVRNKEVGDQIVQMFEKMRLIPTLFFVDPWGYKGLSLRLVNSVLKNWGCDCIIFFNYNRINMGLENDFVKDHMDALFGSQRGNILRQRLEPMKPHEREMTIVEEICAALHEMGGKYTLPFRFKNEHGNRTSHHLIFVSKHVRGYELMKEIMAEESSKYVQGVAGFEYSPADKKFPLLFELSRPLDELGAALLKHFAGQKCSMLHLYEAHHIGTPYIKRNYKEILKQLEITGKIACDPPMDKRQKRKGEATFGDNVTIIFPSN